MMAVATEPLRGKALLSKLKEIPTLSKSEKAKACGYVTRTKDRERANLSEFIEAILEAQGLAVEPEQAGGRGRTPTYRVSVHTNGQIVIGKAYTEMMGLRPGDEFEIKLGYKHIKLVLVQPAGGSSNDEE
ncbi:AbrB family transcriptional regulator [Leptolyngbya sp. GB1-A1]|uniref:AbrB family transcriptional regulator n=1 Tax=Leptolyngbya sp. GB1-A1 TaxID=2933908 RepID=UPI0032987C18